MLLGLTCSQYVAHLYSSPKGSEHKIGQKTHLCAANGTASLRHLIAHTKYTSTSLDFDQCTRSRTREEALSRPEGFKSPSYYLNHLSHWSSLLVTESCLLLRSIYSLVF